MKWHRVFLVAALLTIATQAHAVTPTDGTYNIPGWTLRGYLIYEKGWPLANSDGSPLLIGAAVNATRFTVQRDSQGGLANRSYRFTITSIFDDVNNSNSTRESFSYQPDILVSCYPGVGCRS